MSRVFRSAMLLSAFFTILGSVTLSMAVQAPVMIQATGTIAYWPQVDISVNVSKITGSNYLSLGTNIDWEWKLWLDRPIQRDLTRNAGFRLIRFFDFRKTDPPLNPCIYWNESTMMGTWNWTNVDMFVTKIFEIGAEPLICLGWACDHTQSFVPPGMAVNPSTGLPDPSSWAAYCKEYVKHFKSTSKPVRFYETTNEPWIYFGWDDYTRIANFMNVFNAAAQAMRAENSAIMVSFDGTNRKPVLDYWLTHGGADLGFISFHKYDSGTIGYYTDEAMLNRAESFLLATSPDYYGIQDARQVYFNARGIWIPVINSESNFNSACDDGTDPKIQQIIGAVWTALMLRKGVLNGLNYSAYYSFSSSASWEKASKHSGGLGFGMINSDNDKPWYPYYVQKMLGNNLGVNDLLLESTCSSNDVRTLSWLHDGKLQILLICKTNQTYSVHLHGTTGIVDATRIDNRIPWENPALQLESFDASQPFELYGYSVVLLSTD